MLLAAGRSTRLGALGPRCRNRWSRSAATRPSGSACTPPRAPGPPGGRQRVPPRRHGAAQRWGTASCARDVDRSHYSVEEELLGTGGGLAKARPLFGAGPVAGDERQGRRRSRPAGAAARPTRAPRRRTSRPCCCATIPTPRRWGAIACDATGRVVGILDARSPRAARRPRDRADVHRRPRAGAGAARSPAAGRVATSSATPTSRAARGRDHLGRHARRLLRRALDAGALPGGQPRAAARPGACCADPPGPLVGVDPGAAIDAGARVIAPCRIAAGAIVEAGAERRARCRASAPARASPPARASSAPSSGPGGRPSPASRRRRRRHARRRSSRSATNRVRAGYARSRRGRRRR